MATEDNLIPLENGQGLNHIDSVEPPPPPPPLMPPPPPPPIPPEAKGQPDDLLTFQNEDCAEPCLEPQASEVPEPPPPVPEPLPPPSMDGSMPEEEPSPSAEEAGLEDPLPPQFVPPPVPEVVTHPPTEEAESESSPETDSLPREEDLPPVSMDNFSPDNFEQLPEDHGDSSPPQNDVEMSRPYVQPPSMEEENEVPETEYPPAQVEALPPETEPLPTSMEPVPPEPEPTPNEEEIAAPTWSDEPEPEPVMDYPSPEMNHLHSDMYPESAMGEPQPLPAMTGTYPAESETPPEVEAYPMEPERIPEPKASEEDVPAQMGESSCYTTDPTDVPVELAAMAGILSAGKESSPREEPVSPVVEPPRAYDMNTTPHSADLQPMGVVEPPREDHVHVPPATSYVLPPQGYDVIDEEQGQTTAVMVAKEEKGGGGGEGCCARCVRCLSQVPCGSLVSWILLVLGLGALAGSLLVGTRKARNLLHDDGILWFMEMTVTGVVVGMFVLGTCFLVVAHLSSEPTCRRLFNSSSKNTCARGLNIFLLVFVYLLLVCWVLVSILLTTPVVLLVIVFVVRGTMHPGDCLDLHNYGFAERKVCFPELHMFTDDAQDVLICYGVSLLAAIFVVISLVHFLICLSANIAHLRDSRFAALNTYEAEEDHNSKHAMLDTNM